MHRFRNIWFALAALLWLPAYAHCQLESLTGLEILKCAETASASHSSASDCENCCAAEKTLFRAEFARLVVPPPVCLLPAGPALLLVPDPARFPPASLDLTAAPPDLTRQWHFIVRTALPVRAPSLVS